MAYSRISRIEERRTKKQLILVLGGIIILTVLLFTVGIPLVVNLSVAIGNLKSNQPLTTVSDTTAPLPPVLAPVVSATNSANLKITGYAEPESTLTLILNGLEEKRALVGRDGEFLFTDIALVDGDNLLYATTTDQAGNESKSSNTLNVTFKKGAPLLEISEPAENQSFGKSSQEITVRGTTTVGNHATLNDRFVAVRDDGSFFYVVKLNDGENILTIIVRDPAGNETKLERKVFYAP